MNPGSDICFVALNKTSDPIPTRAYDFKGETVRTSYCYVCYVGIYCRSM